MTPSWFKFKIETPQFVTFLTDLTNKNVASQWEHIVLPRINFSNWTISLSCLSSISQHVAFCLPTHHLVGIHMSSRSKVKIVCISPDNLLGFFSLYWRIQFQKLCSLHSLDQEYDSCYRGWGWNVEKSDSVLIMLSVIWGICNIKTLNSVLFGLGCANQGGSKMMWYWIVL